MTFILISAAYGKGHKRFKLSNDGRDRDSVTCSASVNERTTVSRVIDFSNPFTVQHMLDELDGGRYGSVTKEIEALLSRKMQTFSTVFVKHPHLTSKLLDDGDVKSKEDCSSTGHDDVIDLEDGNNKDKALAAPLTIEISDSDEEDRRDLKPSFSFQAVDLKHQSGEVLVKEIEVIFPSHTLRDDGFVK